MSRLMSAVSLSCSALAIAKAFVTFLTFLRRAATAAGLGSRFSLSISSICASRMATSSLKAFHLFGVLACSMLSALQDLCNVYKSYLLGIKI